LTLAATISVTPKGVLGVLCNISYSFIQNSLIRALLLISFTFFVVSGYAQHPWYHHITTYDGLPSNTVYWMMQDSSEYMWMGTENGLTRYDGKDFKTYNDHPDLISYDFNTVHQDSKGDIWSHNFANQIVRIRVDSMAVYEHPLFTQEGHYVEMVVGNNDDIYVRIINQIVRYLPEKNTYENIYSGSENKRMYYMTYAEGILSVMMAGSDEFFRYDEASQTSQIVKIKTLKGRMRLKAFQLTCDQTLLIDSRNVPKHIYTIKNDSLAVFDALEKYNLPENFRINNIKKLANGDIWYCTSKGALRHKDGLRLLPKTNTSNILVDNEKNIWISSLSEGVFVVPDLNISLYTLQNSDLEVSVPSSAAFDEEGNLWIGTIQNKVLHWSTDSKKLIQEYNTDRATNITDIFYDSPIQYLWANGLFKFKKNKNNYEQTIVGGSIKQAFILPNNEILIRGGRDRLYHFHQDDITQTSHNQFSKYWKKDTFEYAKGYLLEDDLFKSPINTIHYDAPKDKIWIGLGNRTVINTRDTIRDFFIEKNTPFISNCFEQSSDGNMWVGVRGGGFVILKNGNLHIDCRSDIYKGYGEVRLIKCSEKHVWIATENDLLLTDYQGKILKTYNALVGIPANNITDITASGNEAWLCTKNGLISLDYEAQIFEKLPVPIIQNIEIQGVEHPVTNYSLPYHQNTFNINFTSIFPYCKTDFEYVYRLLGEHEDWRSTSTTSAPYPKILPGAYTFELKTHNKNGKESEVVGFDIEIKKPYWQSLWFILMCIFAVAAVSYFFYKENAQRIAQRNYYKQQLRSSQLTALKTQMNPHFIFNALNSIQEFIILNEKRLANEYLSKFARLMRVYLNHSSKDWVPLEEELQALQLYLDLEKLRFENTEIRLDIDPKLEHEDIRIPPLFVQPYVENAFKHGLLHKIKDRKLYISFNKTNNNTLQIIIEDNGVGRKKAVEIKSKRSTQNPSFSMTANQERLKLLNYNKIQQIKVNIIDLEENNFAAGTKVIIQIPN